MENRPPTAGASGRTALLVRVGESLHGIPISVVEEVLPSLPIEPVPECPRFVKGAVFVRGHLIPIVDALERLGQDRGLASPDPHIVCVRAAGRLIGLIVDEALDLIDLGEGISLGAGELGGHDGFFTEVHEVDGKLIRLLSPEKMLDPAETAAVSRIPRTG